MTIIVFALITLTYCCHGPFIVNCASGDNHDTTELLNREKRRGGGGIIPFRPLFVYRQQQREQQAKWKEIEARKKLRQQLLQYQQYEETIKQSERLYPSRRPATTTPFISYSNPTTKYSSYNYPSTYYPSYYGRYDYDNDRQQESSSNYYYKNYYDGYDYSSYF